MAEQRRVVFDTAAPTDRLPDWASDGFVMIEWLQEQGLWTQVPDRLKIQREGGYTGIDAFQFLLYFFGAHLGGGLKLFSEKARPSHKRLAAVGGCKRLPTQASVSRLLSAVEVERVRDFGSWLLRQAPDITAILTHPSVLTRDALGQGWHVFDWDPTVTTLRHRALPVIEGTPEGRRRSEALAEPGYPGRKRGDVQFSRATLQHAGSGLWLGIEMGPGNGALREAFEAAVGQVVATCEQVGIPRERAILRSDGAGGNVPFITACVDESIHYITRLAHYQLLQDEVIIEHLNEADWFEVPSSGSGPQRQATDLGQVLLDPAQTSRRKDGSFFESVETRVVVSRFPVAEAGRGAGVTLEGWHYELYGTDLPVDAWPQGEIVAGYYGRGGQENRFCQEDREQGLDRIFSYHLPGQQLATLVGLFVWNFQTCRGMDLAQPPEDLPEQPAAQCSPVAQTPTLAGPSPTEPPMSQDGCPDGDRAVPTTAFTVDSAAADSEAKAADTASGASSATPTRQEVIQTLDEVDWERILEKHKGWRWLADDGGLLCPGGALLPLVRIEDIKGIVSIRARFEAPWGSCDSCELRQSCINSKNPRYRKDVRLPLPSPTAEAALTMWSSLSRTQQSASRASAPSAPVGRHRSRVTLLNALRWHPPSVPSTTPLFAVAPPTLLPAELRKLCRRATVGLEIQVRAELPPVSSTPSPVLAGSAAERQRRRKSWEERLRWNELPDGSRVEIRCLDDGAVRRLLEQVNLGAPPYANAA